MRREELNVPMLLAHFGMPSDLAVDDVEPVCETEEEEVIEEETGSRVFSFMSNISVVCSHTVEELSGWKICQRSLLKAFKLFENNDGCCVKGILGQERFHESV